MTQIYRVLHWANKERSNIPGYGQAVEVFDSELSFLGGWYDPHYGRPDTAILIQDKTVRAFSPIEAIFRFHQWLTGGHDESFFTQETPKP